MIRICLGGCICAAATGHSARATRTKKCEESGKHQRPSRSERNAAHDVSPMLPEQLSTDTTSLLETEDKLSIVIEFVVGKDGSSIQAVSTKPSSVIRHSLLTTPWGPGLRIRVGPRTKWLPRRSCNRSSSCRMRLRKHSRMSGIGMAR